MPLILKEVIGFNLNNFTTAKAAKEQQQQDNAVSSFDVGFNIWLGYDGLGLFLRESGSVPMFDNFGLLTQENGFFEIINSSHNALKTVLTVAN